MATGTLLTIVTDGRVFEKSAYYGNHEVTLMIDVYYDADNNKVGLRPTVTYRRLTTSTDLVPDELNNITINGQTLQYDNRCTISNEYGTSGSILAQNYKYLYPDMNSWDSHFKTWYEDGFDYQDYYTVTWNYGNYYTNTFTINVAAALQEKFERSVTFSYPSMHDFTDNENPTMKYMINDGELVEKIEFSLSFDGANASLAWQEVSYIGDGSRTFTYKLTEDDRNTIRSQAYNTYRLPIYGVLRFTAKDGRTHTEFTNTWYVNIQGVKPTVNPTWEDTNATTVALTGNSKYLIRYHSMAHIDLNAIPGAGAEISSAIITWGGKTVKDQTADMLCETTGQISYTIYDSRDNVVSGRLSPIVKNYVRLTCTLVDRTAPDAATGTMTFSVKGAYWNDNFGAVQNTLDVQYRYKEYDAEDYCEWVSLPFGQVRPSSIQGDYNYTASGSIEGLNYLKSYQLQVRAVDKLETASTQTTNIVNEPIFDWSKNDFRINVPAEIQGWTYGSNEVLWESNNGNQMTNSDTIYLSRSLQEVGHGIVLIFSLDSEDLNWNTHFVPKEMVNRNQGAAQCFLMVNNAGFGRMAAKYLHIYDETIKGHVSNTQAGTGASGITFDNSQFVLRAVIGV